ncbi:MAG: hypothetical protein J6M34_00615 [Clostridia bacterium]|nr:hypothetical protein [Clostridia bacterium]
MKYFFKIPTLLYYLTCIATFWLTAIMYPYNVYYYENSVPFLSFTGWLTLAGIGAILGTVLFVILSLLSTACKPLGLHRNLIAYFFFHFLVCSGFSIGVDYLFDFIHFSPYWVYLLLGFIPATLCSIIHSYEVSHQKRKEADQKARND